MVRRSVEKMVKSSPDSCAGVERKVKKTNPYKGVTFYRRTGKWEANLWFNKEQHYLGASFSALGAARVYDKAFLFARPSTDPDHLTLNSKINFNPSDYAEDVEEMKEACTNIIDCRELLRLKKKEENCRLLNPSDQEILIDENGRWEVKYKLKTKVATDSKKKHEDQKDPKKKPEDAKDSKVLTNMYALVGWFDTEEAALSAYNEAALKYDGATATIESFRTKRPAVADITPEVLTNVTSTSGPGDEHDNGDLVTLEQPPGLLESEPQAIMHTEAPYETCLPRQELGNSCHWELQPEDVQVKQVENPSTERPIPYEQLDYWTHRPYHDPQQEADIDVMHCSHAVKPVARCQHLPLFTIGNIFSISTASAKDLSHLQMIPPFDIGLGLSR